MAIFDACLSNIRYYILVVKHPLFGFSCSCIAALFCALTSTPSECSNHFIFQIFFGTNGQNVFHLKFRCVVDGEVSDSSLILIQLDHRKVIFVHSQEISKCRPLAQEHLDGILNPNVFKILATKHFGQGRRERFSYCIKTHTSSYCWLSQKPSSETIMFLLT